MVAGNQKVVWTDEAKQQLKAALAVYQARLTANAQKVLEDIVAMSRQLPANPEHYSLDKYKFTNDGSYRAFEKHKFRVAYRVLPKEIRILRVRHTKMEPLEY